MPTFYVVVGTNWLFVDAPVLWCEVRVLDPLAFHVVDEIQKGSVRSREMARREGPYKYKMRISET